MESSDKNNPLVSVIIPIYNVEKYIEKCARSVFGQTYNNLEIIFVNDCTPDNSVLIVEEVMDDYPEIKPKTRILSYSQNRGVAGARKYGLEHAHGKFLLQLDSDDYISTVMIENMVRNAVKNNADVVICDYFKDINGAFQRMRVNPSLDNEECVIQLLNGQVHSSVCNKLIRRSLFEDNDIWPVPGLDIREDLAVMFRLIYVANKISYLPEAYYYYVQRPGSYTNSGFNLKMIEYNARLCVLMDEFCKQQNIQESELLMSFSYFVMYNLPRILRYSYREIKIDYIPLRLKYYFSLPYKLPFIFKVVGICQILNIPYSRLIFHKLFRLINRF